MNSVVESMAGTLFPSPRMEALQQEILQSEQPFDRFREIASTMTYEAVKTSLCSPEIEARLRQFRNDTRSFMSPTVSKIRCLFAASEACFPLAEGESPVYRSLLWLDNPFIPASAGFYTKEGRVGQGSFKIVNLVRPLFPTAVMPPFVISKVQKDILSESTEEAVLKPECTMSEVLERLGVPYVVKNRRIMYERSNGTFSYRMVSEFCVQGTLKHFVTLYASCFIQLKMMLALQLLEALRKMHEQNFFHLDLKLANIFVTDGAEGPEVRIGDLGAMRMLCERGWKNTSRVVSTYPAPEMFRIGSMGGQVFITKGLDLWDFGDILYFLRYNSSVFDGWRLSPDEAHLADKLQALECFRFKRLLGSDDPLDKCIGELWSSTSDRRPSEEHVEAVIRAWLPTRPIVAECSIRDIVQRVFLLRQ